MSRSARPASRSLYRIAEFAQRKWRDIYYEPLRVVYRKDKVSRARNILVYKSQRNLAVPLFGAFWAVAFCVGLEFTYEILYLEEHKKLEHYDKNDINLEIYLPIVGLIAWTICAYRLMTRHISRVYYNEAKKEFTLITYNLVAPFSTMRRVVRAGAGRLEKKPDSEFIYWPGDLFPRVTYNCSIDGQKYMLHPEFFKYPVYFNVLFGFDDPEAIAKLEDSDRTADQIFRQRESDGRVL